MQLLALPQRTTLFEFAAIIYSVFAELAVVAVVRNARTTFVTTSPPLRCLVMGIRFSLCLLMLSFHLLALFLEVKEGLVAFLILLRIHESGIVAIEHDYQKQAIINF